MAIEPEPIGFVEESRTIVDDDFSGGGEICITLTVRFASEALPGDHGVLAR